MQITALSTPAMLIDTARVAANCAAMSSRARSLGVTLRPHMKTHKCTAIGRMQVGGDAGPITVSTLAEAHHFRDAGFTDITLAVPIAPHRAVEAVSLGLRLLVDSSEAVDAIEAAVGAGGVSPVFLKVDCGYGRAGVQPGSASAVALARRLHASPAIDFRGLLTHGGHSYDCVSVDEIRVVAAAERDSVVGFAGDLRALGLPVPEVSVGSTPTMMHVDHLEGVTEMRPGNYALFDAFQAAIGSCGVDDVAVSVLATVLGVYPGRVVLDAGALALSKDSGATHVDPDCGYGQLYDLDLRPIRDLKLVGLSQEHGRAEGPGAASLRVGDKVRVVPNHSCLAMACFDGVAAIEGGQVVDRYRPCRGW